MEERKNTGGPVYPCNTFTRDGFPSGVSMGMTLRQWYAGQALQGILAHCFDDLDAEGSASYSVRIADAMIAELEK